MFFVLFFGIGSEMGKDRRHVGVQTSILRGPSLISMHAMLSYLLHEVFSGYEYTHYFHLICETRSAQRSNFNQLLRFLAGLATDPRTVVSLEAPKCFVPRFGGGLSQRIVVRPYFGHRSL